MKRLRTLRVRFAFWTASLVLVILVAFGIYVYISLAQELYAALDNSLTIISAQVLASLDVQNDRLALSENFIEDPEISSLDARGFALRFLTPDGDLIQQVGDTGSLPSPSPEIVFTAAFATQIEPVTQTNVRVYTTPIRNGNETVAIMQIGQSMEEVQETLADLLSVLLISVPGLVLIAGFGGYWLAARALAPVDRITRTAQRISAEDLSARLNLQATDDEVGRLAGTFDAMLARLDDSFRRERQFTADAAHELRTPLAAMQAILSVIREKRRSPAEYEQALADLSEEAERLRVLAENLLHLAREGSKKPRGDEVLDLSTLLRDVADSLRPLAEAKTLSLTVKIPDKLTFKGDRDELIRLFVNLLDNAIKYTEDGQITIFAEQTRGGELSILIADTGIGIAKEHLPHIFDRFYRVDKARTIHSAGLGLAIALGIARAHGGNIEASSFEGKGTQFAVRLPAAV